VVFDLWLGDTHPVHLPVDVVSAKRQRFRECPGPSDCLESSNSESLRLVLETEHFLVL
jgi:hypothetical protein